MNWLTLTNHIFGTLGTRKKTIEKTPKLWLVGYSGSIYGQYVWIHCQMPFRLVEIICPRHFRPIHPIPHRIHVVYAIYGAPWIPSIYPLYVSSWRIETLPGFHGMTVGPIPHVTFGGAPRIKKMAWKTMENLIMYRQIYDIYNYLYIYTYQKS